MRALKLPHRASYRKAATVTTQAHEGIETANTPEVKHPTPGNNSSP